MILDEKSQQLELKESKINKRSKRLSSKSKKNMTFKEFDIELQNKVKRLVSLRKKFN